MVLAGVAVVGLALAPRPVPTTAAWVDEVVMVAGASAAEFFGCQQAPVVVTTLETPPAQTLTVREIDAECAGAEITVRVYDERQGGELGEFPLVSSFEEGLEGWVAFGGGAVERVTSPVQDGAWSLHVTGRTETFHGPGRDMTGSVVNGQTYLVSVWVFHEGAATETFQFTAFEELPGGEGQFRAMAVGDVPPGEWTRLEGEIAVDPGSVTQLVYVEALTNPTLEFFIDAARAETPGTAPAGGWVTATGSVDVPETTLDTDVPFYPVVEPKPVEVEIDGHAVPATWVYERPPVLEGCTVVERGTSTPVPGVVCESVVLTVGEVRGPVGARVLPATVGFVAPGISQENQHEIVFTVDLSAFDGVPGDWQWAGSGVLAGSFLPYEGYSCADLPVFSARAPAWTAGGGAAYIELHEAPTADDPVCGP